MITHVECDCGATTPWPIRAGAICHQCRESLIPEPELKLQPIPEYVWEESKTLISARKFWEQTQSRVDPATGVMVKYPGTIEFTLARVLSEFNVRLARIDQRLNLLEIRTGLCDPPEPPPAR